MSRGARDLLQKSTLVLRRGPYLLGSWPLAMQSAVHAGVLRARVSFSLVLTDELEVSALLAESALPLMPAPRRSERGFALLTLDTPMEWNVVGVLAALSEAMAQAGVPLGAFSAYSRDHLIVQHAHLDAALTAARKLVSAVDERS